MSRRIPTAALFFSTAMAMSMLVGCEDKDARALTETQDQILTANRDLQAAVLGAPAPGTDEYEQARQTLNGLISRINGIRGGESGQQSAKALMLANAYSQLAALDKAQIDKLEVMNSTQSIEVIAIAQRSADLAYRAQTISSLDLSSSRNELDESQDQINAELALLTEQIGELQGPIDDRVSQNNSDSEEARQLRLQSSELMRQARESGYSSGFDRFEEAIRSQRQADRIEYGISQREIELDLNLQAEHNYLSINRQNAENAIEAISSARNALNEFEQQGAADNSQTRQTLDSMQEQLITVLDELNTRIDTELSEAYASLQKNLEQVISQANSAASKGGKDGAGAARMVAVRAQESLGKLHWAKARGIHEMQKNYESIADAGDALGMEAAAREAFDRLSAAYEQSLQAALAQYTQAQSLLSQVSGGDQSQINAYRQNLQLAIDALSGSSTSAPDAPSDSADETAPATDGADDMPSTSSDD